VSVLFGRQRRDLNALTSMEQWGRFTPRSSRGKAVTSEQALRHSGVWACLRLRANLISSLPVDTFRKVGGIQVEVNTPTLLREPEEGSSINEWMWATQYDLDRYGNCFGLVTSKTSANYPARVELVPAGDVTVRTKGRRIVQYVIEGTKYDPSLVWHERQYRPAGSPMGLSPIAYAAWSISGYLSAQKFALDWYDSGASPAAVLKNIQRAEIPPEVASATKERFKGSVQDRDVFVTGRDWEFTPLTGDANSAAFLEQMRYGIPDVCRFLDVPADMVDGETSSGSITYASITQRNVQLLVMSLTAPIVRREWALSKAIPRPQFVKLNTDALLRMDPKTRAELLTGQVVGRTLTPDEARALDNREPLTEADYAQFDRLWPPRQQGQDTTPRARARGVDGGIVPPDGGMSA
jgi:HK97 family phage portal protein